MSVEPFYRRVLVSDSSGNVIKISRQRENLAGAAGTGANPNKTFTLTTTQAVDIVEVFVNGSLIVPVTQYTIDNDAKTVDLIGIFVADAQIVAVFYNV